MADAAAAQGKVAMLWINADPQSPPVTIVGGRLRHAGLILLGPPTDRACARLLDAIGRRQTVAWLPGADLAAVIIALEAAGARFDSIAIDAPLAGKRVLLTRPRRQSEGLWRRLNELGAAVLAQPAIEIGPPADWVPVDSALAHLDDYQWLVFSSSNGVRALLERLQSLRGDLRPVARVKLAAIGPGTAEELARYQLRADLVPDEYRAEALADALASRASGTRFLLARASRGRDVLAEQLVAAGALVEQVVVYSSTDVAAPDSAVAQALEAGRIDWITVTSSAIARSLVRLFGPALGRARLASISPITSQTLRELGCAPTVEAREYTMDGLVEVVLETRSKELEVRS